MEDKRISSEETMNRAIKFAHNYTDWVFSAFAPHLAEGSALEVGSGHGNYARKLLPLVSRLYVSDIDSAAVENIRKELAGLGGVEYLVMDGIDPKALRKKVDNIILINVLEHIEDDGAFVARCFESLNPGGRLLVFAPAFELLYSRIDRQAGHFRRYTKSGLRARLEAAGFRRPLLRYFNAVGFFGWLVNKLAASDIKSSGVSAQIEIYDRLIPYFKYFDAAMPFLGQSVLAVCEKGSIRKC